MNMGVAVLDQSHPVDSREKSQIALFWREFRRHYLAVVGLLIIVMLIAVALLAPYLAPYNPAKQHLDRVLAPPSRSHPMGTDDLGRDILSRVIVGSRVSLSVAFVAVVILITIGVLMGMLAGYYRSLDGPLMRVVDLLMSVPNTFLILTIVALFGPGLTNTMLVIGFTAWMGTARLVRGQFLSLREKEFIEAARSVGASNLRIILRHMLLNTVAIIIVQATLFVSYAVITESLLSYLGLGAQPPTPSWGNILNVGRSFMREAWWMTVFPGLAIFITVLAFNFLGDGLRDAFDPRRLGGR
jgi:peptide/nickel transport system permease protein